MYWQIVKFPSAEFRPKNCLVPKIAQPIQIVHNDGESTKWRHHCTLVLHPLENPTGIVVGSLTSKLQLAYTGWEIMWKSWVKEKSSINLTSLVEFVHHLIAEMIWKENEEKKIKVKAQVTAKNNKQHQTSALRHLHSWAAAATKLGQFVCFGKLRPIEVVS